MLSHWMIVVMVTQVNGAVSDGFAATSPNPRGLGARHEHGRTASTYVWYLKNMLQASRGRLRSCVLQCLVFSLSCADIARPILHLPGLVSIAGADCFDKWQVWQCSNHASKLWPKALLLL